MTSISLLWRLSCAFVLGAGCAVLAGVDIDGIRLATYRHDLPAAVSYTYDDGYPDHVTLAAPMLDRYGFKGTFFLIVGNVLENDSAAQASEDNGEPATSWDDWRRIAANGHEIGNHSWSHANLKDKDAATVEYEVNHAYDVITEEIGTAPVSFCFPFNMHDAASREVVRRRHLFYRGYQKTYGGSSFTASQANTYVNQAIAGGEWMVGMIHAILEGFKPFSSEQVLDDHFAYVSSIEDRVWVAPFGEVGLYTRERDAATVSGASVDGDVVSFTLETTLEADRVSVPVTVVIPAPDETMASAVQGGVSLPVTVEDGSIMVEATPGNGPVTVALGVETSVSRRLMPSVHHGTARAGMPHIHIGASLRAPSIQKAYDLRGRIAAGLRPWAASVRIPAPHGVRSEAGAER